MIFKVLLNHIYLKIQFFVLNFLSLFVWLVLGLFNSLVLCTSSGACEPERFNFLLGEFSSPF